ncbi:sirohydrochlorin chelatase [Streptomyces sp. NBC_01808]|uniref:sirohydrochlorin chelatase n=1 Tax=Streptomyces sp. NBC_01808 TaxID=2975947 RepID=UPI002DDA2577|nr:CbiX/SirB N-terminal domain-containing protein [Streptomyces sp. NBC_01808]WSA37717.1 sirohydrochlorin chelatase [Streptomyces sp. NBC_01808]
MTTAAELMSRITAELSTGLAAAGRGRGRPTLVAVAHGSRDPAAARTVRALLAAVRAQRPGLRVRLGHVELNAPLLRDTLSTLTGDAVLVPLLFARGHHVTRDIPETLRAAAEHDRRKHAEDPGHPAAHGSAPRATGALVHAGPTSPQAPTAGGRPGAAPALAARIAAPLGPHPLLAAALAGRLAEAGWRGDGVVLAAAGSRAAPAAADSAATAALLADRLGVPVLPAYASAAAPTVAEAARTLAARGCRRIGVACCFTAPGLFAARTAADARALGMTVAAPLGAHPALARLVLHRYDEELSRPGKRADTTADTPTATTARAAA